MIRILIAEDEEFLSQALKDNLESEGYAVDVAADGEEAMDLLLAAKYGLILLDLLMPNKDGFYVLEEVRKNTKLRSIPIIVLSNLGGDMEIKRALEMGANEYFVKSQHPINEVVDLIRKYLGEGERPENIISQKEREAAVVVKEAVRDIKKPSEKKRGAKADFDLETRRLEAMLAEERAKAAVALAEERAKSDEVRAGREVAEAALATEKEKEAVLLEEKIKAQEAILEEKKKTEAAMSESKKVREVIERIKKASEEM